MEKETYRTDLRTWGGGGVTWKLTSPYVRKTASGKWL